MERTAFPETLIFHTSLRQESSIKQDSRVNPANCDRWINNCKDQYASLKAVNQRAAAVFCDVIMTQDQGLLRVQ